MRLTKKEVVALLSRAIRDKQTEAIKDKEYVENNYIVHDFDFLSYAILQALEDNRILTLVEGEAIKDDLFKCSTHCGWLATAPSKSWIKQVFPYEIVQRNSIPVYHCKQETK